MINESQAIQLKQELHPAFAGYLHDGAISNRDQLASIFALADYGSIDFIYEDNNLTNPIKALRKTNIKPKYEFENKILNLIFAGKTEVPSSKIGHIIQNQSLKEILKTNINPIKNLPLNEDNLKFGNNKNMKINFNVNGVEINSLVKANNVKSSIVAISLSFGIIGIGFLIGSIMFRGLPQMTLMGFVFLVVSITTWWSFFKSQKYVTFELPKNIDTYKQKYSDLYEFLKTHPLDRRKLSDEFLAHEIAFGLNTKWTKEFKIEEDFQINEGKFGE